MGRAIWISFTILVASITFIHGKPSLTDVTSFAIPPTTEEQNVIDYMPAEVSHATPSTTYANESEAFINNTWQLTGNYTYLHTMKDQDLFLFVWSSWTLSSEKYGMMTRTRLEKSTEGASFFIERTESQSNVENLALGKTATASSQYKLFNAGLAIDGITCTNFINASCMHTKFDRSPWLRIDLFAGDCVTNYIDEVIVYNRGDCCSSRANNLTVTVGNDPTGHDNEICATKEDMDLTVARFACNGRRHGRYVHLRIPGPQYLHLCEVEVLGVSISEKFTPFNTYGNNKIYYLDRHDINCDISGQLLSMFHLQTEGHNMRYQYKCCNLPYDVCNGLCTNEEKTTPMDQAGHGNNPYLDRQNPKCPLGFITRLKLQRNKSEDKIQYRYNCCNLNKTLDCYDGATAYTPEGSYNVSRLQQQTVECKSEYALSSFRYLRDVKNGKSHYVYRCCKFTI